MTTGFAGKTKKVGKTRKDYVFQGLTNRKTYFFLVFPIFFVFLRNP